MKATERRLARLERCQSAQDCQPLQITLVYIDMAREPVAATLLGSDTTIEREPGESLEAFERRAELARR